MKKTCTKNGFRKALADGLAFFAIMLAALAYTDRLNWFEADQANNHTKKKWEAFYDFTKNNHVDVVLVGNSRLYTGINPKNLSEALGANCFILASPGTSVVDSYYCLKEALTRTKPKIAVIETFTISNDRIRKFRGQKLSDQFKSYAARKNILQKITSLPVLFRMEHWPEALSSSVRNHSFIFKDYGQLQANMKTGRRKAYDRRRDGLYLGRYVRFTTGLQKDVLERYEKEGAPMDEADYAIGPEHRRYVDKIVRICRDNGVIPVFVSLPVYRSQVVNYDVRPEALAEIVEPLRINGLDRQEEYSELFDTTCFENTYKPNQHMTYQGSLRASYLLADCIRSTFPGCLPDRSADSGWIRLFYGQEGFFENYPPAPGDPVNKMLVLPEQREKFILEADFIQRPEYNELIFKTVKECTWNQIRIRCILEHKGREGQAELAVQSAPDWAPRDFSIYKCLLQQGVQIQSIVSVE